MNLSKFEDWKSSVGDINTKTDKLIQNRDSLYEFMASEVKKSFAKMDLYPQHVHLTPSAHEITVEFYSEDDIIIDPEVLSELHMQFRITYGFDNQGNWRVIIIFYPFMED